MITQVLVARGFILQLCRKHGSVISLRETKWDFPCDTIFFHQTWRPWNMEAHFQRNSGWICHSSRTVSMLTENMIYNPALWLISWARMVSTGFPPSCSGCVFFCSIHLTVFCSFHSYSGNIPLFVMFVHRYYYCQETCMTSDPIWSNGQEVLGEFLSCMVVSVCLLVLPRMFQSLWLNHQTSSSGSVCEWWNTVKLKDWKALKTIKIYTITKIFSKVVHWGPGVLNSWGISYPSSPAKHEDCWRLNPDVWPSTTHFVIHFV